jgi:hypothetical protein
MKQVIFLLWLFAFASCGQGPVVDVSGSAFARGHAASLIKDKDSRVHVAFSEGDSIMYTVSADKGKSFSPPVLVALLPRLASSHSRGPQIALNGSGISIIAGDKSGNIFSFKKSGSDPWKKTARVNDRDTSAREGLMALGGDGNILYAVWLDVRDGHNKMYGSASADAGESWSKNALVYASPDSTICECCKPTVAVDGNHLYVMFRNLIRGNRDLYLIRSDDDGKTFNQAEKLGKGSWKLDGCPMDGGGLVIDDHGNPQTVWRRENKLYRCEPGKTEQEIGEGRSCGLTSVNAKNLYTWTENGEVVCLPASGNKQHLGKGAFPVIQAINKTQAVCVWEDDNQLHAATITL